MGPVGRKEGNFSLAAAPYASKKRARSRAADRERTERFPDEAMNFIIKRAREKERERESRNYISDVGRAKFGSTSEDPRWISGFRAEDPLFILF